VKTKTRKIILGVVMLCLLAAGAIGWSVLREMTRMHRDSATFEFRHNSLNEIARLTTDPQWVTNQLIQMGQRRGRNADWFSGNVLCLQSGEWLVYANKCRKEDPRITDTFVARASDGQWYHSTNHFCTGMIVLLMEGQPKNLSTMVAQYQLRPISPPNSP
jgi:hypothetical protein